MRFWRDDPFEVAKLYLQVSPFPALNKDAASSPVSFEWYIGQQSWRASVNIWKDHSYYRHSFAPKGIDGRDNVLADAGWHCSFCFRTLAEFKLKMQGYSHSDRLGGKTELLDPQRIQKVICKGADIFGMLPEAYNVS